MPTRAQIVECARTFLGTPFRHQGRLKGTALDCIGLPICVGRELGIQVPDFSFMHAGQRVDAVNYASYPTDDRVLQGMKNYLKEIPRDAIRPGDILCLRVPVPVHAAIVTDLPPGLGMVHAYEPNMKVVEHSLTHAWFGRIAGAFLFPELED